MVANATGRVLILLPALSVCLSVCHKNFNLGHNFCTITDRALILGMCVPCDKTFPVVPCRDLDGDLWPSSRSICCRAGDHNSLNLLVCLRAALKPLNWIWRNLIGSKISMSATKFVFFEPIRKPRCGNECGTLYSGARYVALWASCFKVGG